MFEKIKEKNGILEVKITDCDVAVVNSLRRTILSDIPNVAFYFDSNSKNHKESDINILKNDSALHNEFLSQRLSMIPIKLSEANIENFKDGEYNFRIKVENDGNDKKEITTNDIEVFQSGTEIEGEFIFPRNDITGEYILITTLPKSVNDEKTRLEVELKAQKDTAEKSACFSTVSLCTYENSIDEELKEKNLKKYIKDHKTSGVNNEKETLVKAFNTLEYQRSYKVNKYNEPNEFIFKIESECNIGNSQLIKIAFKILLNKFEELIKLDPHKISFEKDDDLFQVVIENETHTVGNLLQALIYNKYVREGKRKIIDFIGYFVPHPLDKRLIIKSKLTNSKLNLVDFKQVFEEALRDVLDQLQTLYLQFEKSLI